MVSHGLLSCSSFHLQVFRHPRVGSSRHLGSVEMLTAFEVSILGRVDQALRSSTPLLEAVEQSDDVVFVETCGSELPKAEIEWLQKRDQRTKPAMEALLGKKLKSPPRVAIFSSGGGVRAMIAMIGALEGEKHYCACSISKRRMCRAGKERNIGHCDLCRRMQWLVLGPFRRDAICRTHAERRRHSHA